MSSFPHDDIEGKEGIRYTVLGASGFVGSRLVRTLNNSSVHCYAPAKGESKIFKQDLGRVFYCIGLTADYVYRPFETIEAHVTFLTRVLTEARFERLVYLSSTRLYDGLQIESCKEDERIMLDPSNGRHIYDISKALGENLCMTASDGRASVARLSCVYDDAPGSPGFLSELLQHLRAERDFTLDSSSGFVRDYVALKDVVVILKSIIDSDRTGIFNVASGENVSNQDIVDTINAFDYRISLNHDSDRQKLATCDISKVKELGFQPVLVRDYLKTLLHNKGINEAR